MNKSEFRDFWDWLTSKAKEEIESGWWIEEWLDKKLDEYERKKSVTPKEVGLGMTVDQKAVDKYTEIVLRQQTGLTPLGDPVPEGDRYQDGDAAFLRWVETNVDQDEFHLQTALEIAYENQQEWLDEEEV